MSISKIKYLTFCSLLSAMTALCGYLAVDTGNLKISLESLPILIAALLFGPAFGLTVGGLGTLIYQLLRYGLSLTTCLWILPYPAAGLIAGLYAKSKKRDLTRGETIFIACTSELFITILNTFVLLIDSKIYGYYHPLLITSMLVPRLLLAVGKGICFAMLVPALVKSLRSALR